MVNPFRRLYEWQKKTVMLGRGLLDRVIRKCLLRTHFLHILQQFQAFTHTVCPFLKMIGMPDIIGNANFIPNLTRDLKEALDFKQSLSRSLREESVLFQTVTFIYGKWFLIRAKEVNHPSDMLAMQSVYRLPEPLNNYRRPIYTQIDGLSKLLTYQDYLGRKSPRMPLTKLSF